MKIILFILLFLSPVVIANGDSIIMQPCASSNERHLDEEISKLENQITDKSKKIVNLQTELDVTKKKCEHGNNAQEKRSNQPQNRQLVVCDGCMANRIEQLEDDVRNVTFGTWGLILTVLGIIIAILSFLGWGGVRFVRNKIEEWARDKAQNVVKAKGLLVQSNVSNHSGYLYYSDYEETGRTKDWLLTSAIRQADWALGSINEIIEKNLVGELSDKDKDELNDLKSLAKNNKMYYLTEYVNAQKKSEENYLELKETYKHEVMKLSVDVKNAIDKMSKEKNSKDRENWLESYAFALYVFGDEIQKNEAENIILGLLTDPEIWDEWRVKTIELWQERISELAEKVRKAKPSN